MGCIHSRVEPYPQQKRRNSSKILRSGSNSQDSGTNPEELLRHLSSEDNHKNSGELLRQIKDENVLKEPKVSTGGLAFNVGDMIPEQAPPKNVAKMVATGGKEGKTKESTLKEREEKLRLKMDDVERRRMFREAERKAKLEERRQVRESVLLKKRGD